MRLLYAIYGYGPEHIGYESHRELAQEMIRRGHQYTVLALARRREMKGREEFEIEDGVPVYRYVCSGYKHLDLVNTLTAPVFKFAWFVTGFWRLLAFLRAHHDYDLILVEAAYPLGSMLYLATLFVPVPFVIYVNGADFISNEQANYGYARFRLARAFERRAFRAARLVRAESLYGAESAVSLGCPPEKMTLVQRNIGLCCYPPAGIPLEQYRAQARARIREKCAITAPRLILASGRLLPIKGFDDLIRALPQVIARVGDTQVLFLGPNRIDTRLGDYQKVLENLAAELGVADRIRFAGSVPYEAVRDYLAAADVVAVPSRQDSGNKLVMEAAAVATPFVATWTAGNARWAPEWDCGLIIRPQVVGELADALVRLLGDPAQARRMGLNGPRFAAMFHPSVVAERNIWLCETALRGGPAPPELREMNVLLHPSPAPAP